MVLNRPGCQTIRGKVRVYHHAPAGFRVETAGYEAGLPEEPGRIKSLQNMAVMDFEPESKRNAHHVDKSRLFNKGCSGDNCGY